MKRFTWVFLLALPFASGSSLAQQKVESKGIKGKVGLESIISGYLSELNGKYKLRVTELRWEPGAHVGDHHHAAPGIRYVASGELTILEQGKTVVYKAGDYYYESGDVTHSADNKSNSPVLVLQFEILPADLKGGTLIPPKPR